MTVSIDLSLKQNEARDLTEEINACLAGKKEGICLLNIMDSVCGLLMTKRGDERVVSDILTDMEHVFPDRRSYMANAEDAAAFTKSAVLGSHKAVNFKDGRLLMEEGVGIFAVCYGKDTETALEIGILS